tara:strand:+ start:158 stop:607 length:450 start_codon:yes stop_codon:yes gene_type:complete
MAQMRKFEQEAIAKEILDTIRVANAIEQNGLEKSSKELKNIRKLQAKAESIHEKERKLYRERRIILEDLKLSIKSFNRTLSPNTNYTLEKDYNDNISWRTDDWNIRQNIENKLAIALLSNDWQERLPEIIESIASQFTVVKNLKIGKED